jgi:predicted enzyme related to lactoylglutathione lyase
MSGASLNLVVIRVAGVERSCRVYAALGLTFTREQHGTGPEHFAAQTGKVTFEIYPRENEQPPPAVRLGFCVPSLDAVLEELRTLGGEILSPPRTSPWGRRAVVLDPDGRRVELTEPVSGGTR